MFHKSTDVMAKFVDVGSILEKRRLEIGMSIDDVSLSLKVKKEVILKIECGDVYELMDKIYYEGFVSKYCNLIGLKSDKVIDYISPQILKLSESKSKKFLDVKYEKRVKIHSSSLKFIIVLSSLCFICILINTVIKKKYIDSRAMVIRLD